MPAMEAMEAMEAKVSMAERAATTTMTLCSRNFLKRSSTMAARTHRATHLLRMAQVSLRLGANLDLTVHHLINTAGTPGLNHRCRITRAGLLIRTSMARQAARRRRSNHPMAKVRHMATKAAQDTVLLRMASLLRRALATTDELP